MQFQMCIKSRLKRQTRKFIKKQYGYVVIFDLYNLMLQIGKVITLKKLFILYLCLVFSFAIMYASVTSTSTLATATVQHFLTATFQNLTIPASSYLYLNFTSGWNVGSTVRANSGDFCENSCNLTNINIATTVNKIRINNFFPNDLTTANISIGISLTNIVNPPQGIIDSISLQLFSGGGVSLGSTTISIKINPGLMTCIATPTNSQVGSTTNYLFSITPNSNIPLTSSGSLVMAFPDAWSDAFQSSAFVYSGCNNTANTISCSVSGNYVTATGLFSVASTTLSFSFTFKNIINPGTLNPNSQLSFQYLYLNGSIASTCVVTVSGLTIPILPNVSFSISSKTGTLKFKNAMPPLQTDELAITFPSQFILGSIIRASDYTNESIIPGGGILERPVVDFALNQLVLYPFQSSSILEHSIDLQDIYIKQPIKTNSISISIRRFGNAYSSATCCNLTLAPIQSITASVSSTTSTVKSTSNYQVNFTITYYGLDYFLLDFCSSFALIALQKYTCYMSMLLFDNLLNCTATSTSQLKVSLNNGSDFSNVFGFESNHKLILLGISNPSVVSCSAVLSSYTLPSNKLEFSNTVSLTYLSTKIIQASLTLSNRVVGAKSDYTFAINNTNVLSAGSILYIYFPSMFNISNLNCLYDGVTAANFNITNSTARIAIPNSMAQYELASHTFTVVQVTNLYSLRPSPAFKLQLQVNGSVIESIKDGVYAKLDTLAAFYSLNVTPSSLVAGQATSYNISFVHNLTIPSTTSTNLTFSFPASFFVSSCSSCSSFQTFTILNTTSYVIISQVINPQALSQTNSIIISLYVDDYLSIQGSKPSPTFTATPVAYTVLSNSSFLGETVAVNITIQQLPINTYFLVITIPTQYKIGTLNAYSLNLTQNYTRTGYSLNFTIANIFLGIVTIYMEGLTNPNVTSSSAWTLTAYNSNNTLIGSGSTSNLFTAPCGINCKQCVNSSYCTSCYNNPQVNNFTLLNTITNTCISPPCTPNSFQTGSICYACNSNCLTCSMFESNCTSCPLLKLYFNYTCLETCFDGYYSNGTYCVACVNNCKVCNSTNYCFTCVSGFILLSNNTCENSCPPSMFNYSNQCTSCPTNCTTCNQQGCMSCVWPNYLCQLSSTVCISTCPQNYYISSNNSWCEACNSPCATCQNTSNNCTSCNTTTSFKYFYLNQCLNNACPAGTYTDQLLQCQPCVIPCSQCYSARNCSSCQPTYYLYAAQGLCTQNCVSNTIVNGSRCDLCTSPCLTCSGSVVTCTSCISNFFLIRDNNTCTSTCLSPRIAYKGVCDRCLTPCLSCDTTNSSLCLICLSGYYRYASTCYLSCPSHTYPNSTSTCALCTPPCAQCSGSANTCTDCYSGSYQLNNQCYSPCPLNYYPYLGNCSLCLPQCNGCIAGGSADQCQACKLPSTNYYNPFTYQCTVSCKLPQYPTLSTPLKCLPCQLPCKTCSSYYNFCGSCYNGNYLINNQCSSACPSNYFTDSTNNICIICPVLCATCTNLRCLTCTNHNYFYAGECYSSCPASAPYIYGSYCRNCLTDSCLVCNTQGICTVCAINTYSYDGGCVTACPPNYETDELTESRCVLVPSYGYATYVQYLQAMKVLAMPGFASLVALLFFIPFAQIKLFGVAVLLALPQTIALTQFIILCLRQKTKLNPKLLDLPQWFVWILLSLHFVFTFLHIIVLHKNRFSPSKQVDKWLNYGSNSYRYRIILFFSLINKQISYLLFSGFFKLPVTSLPFMQTIPRRFYLTHILYMVFQIILILIAALICILKQTITYNYKMFFSAADLLAISTISLLFDFVFLFSANKQANPTPYQKYVLPNVSNHTLPALSDPEEQIVNETDPNNALHRSASDEDIFQSQEMKDIDYKSVFDNNDYFDETPFMENDKIQQGLEVGKFRKKNKKKRGRRRGGKLDVIQQQFEQQQSQDQQKIDNKKRRKGKRGKQQNVGGLSNFLYWKKPKQKKKSPMKVFKDNQEIIMSRIKEKESQFDTITQNDIIFQEEEELENSSDEGYNIQHQSRRALYKPNVPTYYDNLFNLNYASRHHLT